MAGDKERIIEGASIVSTPADPVVVPSVCGAVRTSDGAICVLAADHLANMLIHVFTPPNPPEPTGGQAPS